MNLNAGRAIAAILLTAVFLIGFVSLPHGAVGPSAALPSSGSNVVGSGQTSTRARIQSSAEVNGTVPIASIPLQSIATNRLLEHRLATTALQGPRGSSSEHGTEWLAYDPATQSFYVAVNPSTVDIIPGDLTGRDPTVNVTVSVGFDPFGVAYDNRSGDVFVANSGSSNVSVLYGNASTPIATVAVGAGPTGIAYDPDDNDVYVADNGSLQVSVISAVNLTVVATIPVGFQPYGVAVDPATGRVFVANFGSGNVTVISDALQASIGSVSVGQGPYGVAVDNASGTLYVTNELSDNVSAVNTSTLDAEAAISISSSLGPFQPEGVAYDSIDGYVWVAGGYYSMAVLRPSNESVVTVLNFDPNGVAIDPTTGDVCVTNSANSSFECAVFYPPTIYYDVTFSETGLSGGDSWSWNVSLGARTSSPIDPETYVQFALANGSYPYSIGAPYGFGATPLTGTLVVAGLNVNLTIVFAPLPEYPVSVEEVGLPSSTYWYASFGYGNPGTSSNASSVVLNLTNGSYALNPTAYSYQVNNSPISVIVAGAALTVNVTFYYIPWGLWFFADGLPNGVTYTVSIPGSNRTGTNDSYVFFGVHDGYYPYTINAPSGWAATPATGVVTIDGMNVTVDLDFSPVAVPPYSVTFVASGLPSGTAWSVRMNGVNQSTSADQDNFLVPNGSYAFVVGPPGNYTVTPSTGNLMVAGSSVGVSLAFATRGSPSGYPVSFSEEGLPAGSNWSVTATNIATNQPSSAWSHLTTLGLDLPNGTYSLTAAGPSGYYPALSEVTLTVEGPRTAAVSISFGPAACTGCMGKSYVYPLGTYLIVGIIIAAVVAAAAISFVMHARRPPPAQPGAS
jgi:YVTN family beta-propeller protein